MCFACRFDAWRKVTLACWKWAKINPKETTQKYCSTEKKGLTKSSTVTELVMIYICVLMGDFSLFDLKTTEGNGENWNWQEAKQLAVVYRLPTTAFSQNSHLATPDIGKAQGIQIHSLILIKNQHDTASGPYVSLLLYQTAIHEKKKIYFTLHISRNIEHAFNPKNSITSIFSPLNHNYKPQISR